MSEQPKKPSDNRSATQRLSDLEQAMMSLFNVNDNLVRDVMTLKEAIRLLDNKVNAVIKASLAGEPLTEGILTRIMVENNVAELSQRVRNMASQGFIVAEDQVSEESFVVGSELDDEGNVVNPRLQFSLNSIAPELRAKILGAKVGDTLDVQEGKLKFKVLESYKIQAPKAPEAAPAAAESVSEVAPAAAESVSEASPETMPVPAAETVQATSEAALAAPEGSTPGDSSAPQASNS
jgi:hypothetical protein